MRPGMGWIVPVWGVFVATNAWGQPLRLRADVVGEARAPAGLVVLQAADRYRPWLEAEGLVWMGGQSTTGSTLGFRGSEHSAADVLILTIKLREPHGLGELRAGRFVFSTGAIRPMHVDAVSGVVRFPGGTSVEAMGGFLVAPEAVPSRRDWAGAARVAQRLSARFVLGGSYVRHQTAAGLATEEVGADLATTPAAFLDLAGKAAYDLLSRGVAEASFSAALRWSGDWRLELFGSHRSPGRLLPATSLFSVLGDFPAETMGSMLRWEAAPRLDLVVSAAGQWVGGRAGGQGALRATLRTDDQGDGRLGLELRRQDVTTARWLGIRLIVSEPLVKQVRASAEIEFVRPDVAEDRGSVWPWGLLALSWRSGTGWEAATALEAGAGPQRRFETNALLRVARLFDAL